MHVVGFQQPMYRIAFACDIEDRARLLAFLAFAQSQPLRDHLLGPSDLWQTWARETYIGCSSERILIQSGHRFAGAELLVPAPVRRWWRRTDDLDADGKRFAHYYGSREIPAVHRPLAALHPSVYWRSAEAVHLSGRPQVGRLLEIGAGAGVHVAYRQLLHPSMLTTVIDLPEALAVAFCLYRACGLTVTLPQETHESAIICRLPSQAIEGSFDLAFNMGSFQEMRLETVNAYLSLITDHLTADGLLHHINQETSRHLRYASAAHDLSRFRNVQQEPAPYHSERAGQLMISVQAQVTFSSARIVGIAGAADGRREGVYGSARI